MNGSSPDNRPRRRLCLLAAGQRAETHPLPEEGEVLLGRGPGCQVTLDDPSVEPVHARLRLDGELWLENVGEGETRVAERALERGAGVALYPGDLITLGKVMLVVENRGSPEQRRIWTHGYFEARLEEECVRASRRKMQFGILRIHSKAPEAQPAIEQALANTVRLVDTIACYGDCDYEILLPETGEAGAQLVSERISQKLESAGVQTEIARVMFPKDAQTADALVELAGLRSRGEKPARGGGAILPSHGAMQHLVALVDRIAASDINVLILGETGVGKERMAERVHAQSPRASKPFLALNVSALSETLLESELFGHERGSFTGAVQAKPGLLESADGGTIFLDEIGEMPMSLQAKLLRVLETRQVLRVGGLKMRTIDVRFVSATNRDLEKEIERGTFRQDLYFRLNGISFLIPPLRERTEEIQPLAESFIHETSRRYGRQYRPRLSPQALELMRRYPWPGNIRELRNMVERAVVICPGENITVEHLPVDKMTTHFAPRTVTNRLGSAPAPAATPPVPAMPPGPAEGLAALPPAAEKEDLRTQLRTIERQRIVDALAACAGNQTAAAKLLGIPRRTFVSRLAEYGIPGPRSRRSAS